MWQAVQNGMEQKNFKAIARGISLIESEYAGYETFLQQLPAQNTSKVIGITGPPGAGKSTLTDSLLTQIVNAGHTVAVLCVDPSSPFNLGALLGDRVRMSQWYTHPQVYIRSLATRGSLGGLHPKILEITQLLQSSFFNYIIIETVGVGQSEIEIAGLADCTVVTLVPEAGDEIQTMKAGLMEIADVFVVNKADRPEANQFIKNLKLMLAPAFATKQIEIPIYSTVATTGQGIVELWQGIENYLQLNNNNEHKNWLLAERAWQLIVKKRMHNITKQQLFNTIKNTPQFNLYQFVNNW
jgi:LAO/AO transport system kinase